MNRRGEDRRRLRLHAVRQRRRLRRRHCERRAQDVAWQRPRSEDLRTGERVYRERRA